MFALFRDLSERRRAEEALRRKAEAQARAARDVASLAALAADLAERPPSDPDRLRADLALFAAHPGEGEADAAGPVDLADVIAAAARDAGAPPPAVASLPAASGSPEALRRAFALLFRRALAAEPAGGLRLWRDAGAPRGVVVAAAGEGGEDFELALCRRLMEAQGGALRVTPQADGPSAVALTFA